MYEHQNTILKIYSKIFVKITGIISKEKVWQNIIDKTHIKFLLQQLLSVLLITSAYVSKANKN